MNWKIAGTVLVKEVRETIRDRRTLMIMVVVPAFLYPAMFVLMQQLALFGQRSVESEPVRVAVLGGEAAELPIRPDSNLVLVPGDAQAVRRVREGSLDAAVMYRAAARDSFGSGEARIIYDRSRTRSAYARSIVEEKLQASGDTLLARRLAEQSLPESFAAPLAVSDTSVATAARVGGSLLGRFLPMILILMTVLGAFYPAIDLAAGEKERGTLEPLLTVPVPADELVAGKFAAVTVIALAAASLNLLSMMLTFQSGVFQLSQVIDLEFTLPLSAAVLVFFALLLLAVLFASLFLGIAVRSHSFKEAQNALTPVYTVSILPALIAVMPGIEFTPTLAFVPIAGVSLLFRELLTGDVDLLPVVIAIASTLLYAMTALIFAVRAFGREDVLFGDAGATTAPGSWRERLRTWRTRVQPVPGPGAALLFVSFIALLGFYLGARLQISFRENGLLLSQWLLIGIPAILFAVLGPYDVRATLALRRPSARALAAAVLIVAGGLPLGWLLGWLQTRVLEVPEEFLGALQGLLTANDPWQLLWILVLVAVTPAICEELVFRGVLLQGLSRRLPMVQAVLLSAAIFGTFHLSTATVIRFLPTAWIGLLLGYVVWHTRSIYTGMLMHFINNAVAVLLVSSVALQSFIAGPDGQPHWPLVAVAPLLLGAGVWLLPKRPAGAEEEEVDEEERELAAAAPPTGSPALPGR